MKNSILNNSTWNAVLTYFKTYKAAIVDDATKYACEVVFELKQASFYVKLACARHLLFLYKQQFDPNFPFIYQQNILKAIINFSQVIIIPETRKPFLFMDFRKFMAGFIFGWVYKNDSTKFITNEVFDVEARKQWKSSFWAMIALCVTRGLLQDGKAEVYFCGPTKDSSKIPYEIALSYLFRSQKLSRKFLKYNSLRIVSKKMGVIRAVAFDKAALEGKNPSFVVLTEYHLHKDDSLQESAKSSKNLSRKNQMLIYDTTKGHNVDGVCYLREKDYKRFLLEQIQNPNKIHENYHIFLFAAELDENDILDWGNENLWIKANPGLGISVSLKDLKQEFSQITTKQAEMEFMTKRLGVWVGSSSAYFNYHQVFLSNDATKPVVSYYLANNFAGLNPIMGLDLAAVKDTSSVCLMWEIDQTDGESIWVFKIMGFVPAENLIKKEQIDGVPYRDWQNKGFITATPGNVIDYDYVSKTIKEWKILYQPQLLCYDPWQFETSIKPYLLKTHIFYEKNLKPIKQGVWLSPFFKAFERKLSLKKIHFLDNEYAISHVLHVGIKTTAGLNDNIIPTKVVCGKRIDAFASMLFCISQVVNVENKKNIINFVTIS